MKDLGASRLWTARETADHLRITERSLLNFRRRGLIEACLLEGCVRFDPGEVARFIEASRERHKH
jgi:hypothetical protein